MSILERALLSIIVAVAHLRVSKKPGATIPSQIERALNMNVLKGQPFHGNPVRLVLNYHSFERCISIRAGMNFDGLVAFSSG